MSWLKRGGPRQAAHDTTSPHRPQNYNSSRDQWLSWCDDNGVIAPALMLHQWVRTNAPHKGYENTSLSVMLKDDCIHVKNWTTDENFTFFDNNHTTTEQCQYDIAERQRIKQLANKQQQTDYEHGKRLATILWHEAIQAPVSGYFSDKGLTETHGARWHQGLNCWLVLITDIDGNIKSVQKIYNDGNKRYLKGGRTTGGLFVIGSFMAADKVLVCEGFSTGCSLAEQTGDIVVVAFTCHNLTPVCIAIREKYPSVKMVVCADDDRRTTGNPGRREATKAATATGADIAYPPLCADCSCTDFNDVANCKAVTL